MQIALMYEIRAGVRLWNRLTEAPTLMQIDEFNHAKNSIIVFSGNNGAKLAQTCPHAAGTVIRAVPAALYIP